MKTILKIMVLATAFCAQALTSFAASDAASLRIEKLNDGFKQVALELQGFSQAVEVILLDDKNQRLLEEHIPAGAAFAKVLDLSHLKSGVYHISVGSDKRETVQPLRITAADVILYADQRIEYFAPTIRVEGRTLDVNWFNTRVAHMEVAILETGGTEVFSETMRNVIRVERRYNLNDLRKGRYVVCITTPRKTHFQTIDIQ